MFIVGLVVSILVGAALIWSSKQEIEKINESVSEMQRLALFEKRLSVPGRVVERGINVDFPFIIFDWPEQGEDEPDDIFDERLKKARSDYDDAVSRRTVFGDAYLKYQYKAPDSKVYISRTITRLPSEKYGKKYVLKAKKGRKIKVYLNPDDYADALLKKNENIDYQNYRWGLTKPYYLRILAGVIVIFFGLISPFTFQALIASSLG